MWQHFGVPSPWTMKSFTARILREGLWTGQLMNVHAKRCRIGSWEGDGDRSVHALRAVYQRRVIRPRLQ